MSNFNLENKDINVALRMPGVWDENFSFTFQPDYTLSLAEFNDIKRPHRVVDWLASGIFLIGLSILFSCIGRLAAKNFQLKAEVESYEWIVAFIVILIAFIIWIIGIFIKNPKKIVMRNIDKHFENHPPIKQTIGKRS